MRIHNNPRGTTSMFEHLHLGAAAVAALATFVIGGPWYSPALFGKAWGTEAGIDPTRKSAHPAVVFGVAYVCALIGAVVLDMMLGADTTVIRATMTGALLGFGIAATNLGINYAFAGRSPVMWLIDAAYATVLFAVMGAILAAWPWR
jgi:hypothetical protein